MKEAGWGAAIVFCLAFMLPGWSFAARPLFTEDAGTIEKGSVEIELAFDHARDENRDKYYVSLIPDCLWPNGKVGNCCRLALYFP